ADEAWAQGEQLLVGELASEGVEDARELVGCTGADRRLVDLRGVRGFGLDHQPPAARTPASDDGGFGSPIAILEADGKVRGLGRLDQLVAGTVYRSSRSFLVAGQDDRELELVEGADFLQRAQGLEHHHQAP